MSEAPMPEPVSVSDLEELLERAGSISVTDNASGESAAATLQEIARRRAGAEEEIAPLRDRLRRAREELAAAEARALKPLKDAEKALKAAIEGHLAAEADRLRSNRGEAAVEAEQARRAIEAEKLESAGDPEAAARLLDLPIEVEVDETVDPDPVVPDGLRTRKKRVAEVTDFRALVRYVSRHLDHIDLLRPAPRALDAMARADGGLSPISGVRFIVEHKVSSPR